MLNIISVVKTGEKKKTHLACILWCLLVYAIFKFIFEQVKIFITNNYFFMVICEILVLVVNDEETASVIHVACMKLKLCSKMCYLCLAKGRWLHPVLSQK